MRVSLATHERGAVNAGQFPSFTGAAERQELLTGWDLEAVVQARWGFMACFSSGSTAITRFGCEREFYAKACELSFKGIASKRADAPYTPGDRGLWDDLRRGELWWLGGEHPMRRERSSCNPGWACPVSGDLYFDIVHYP